MSQQLTSQQEWQRFLQQQRAFSRWSRPRWQQRRAHGSQQLDSQPQLGSASQPHEGSAAQPHEGSAAQPHEGSQASQQLDPQQPPWWWPMPNIRSSSSKALAFALAKKNRPAAITPDIAKRDVMVGLLEGKTGKLGVIVAGPSVGRRGRVVPREAGSRFGPEPKLSVLSSRQLASLSQPMHFPQTAGNTQSGYFAFSGYAGTVGGKGTQ